MRAAEAEHATAAAQSSAWSMLLLRRMIIGIVLGLTLGYFYPQLGSSLQPFGTAFIDAIKMVVIPLVFSSVTLGVWKIGSDTSKLGKMAAIAFGWFLSASLVSIAIGIGLNELFHPGIGAGLQPTGKVPPNLATSVDWVKFFLDLIPSNVLAAMAGQKVLPTVLFAVLFGLVLSKVGAKAAPIVNVLEALLETMFLLTRWIVALAPVAAFGIMAWLVATQGSGTLIALGKLVGILYLGFALLWLCFWAALLCVRENPIKTTRKVLAPLLLGFTTRSSEATLPLHMETLASMGVPDRVVSVVLPLGYSFNLDGASLYQALSAMFLVEAYGIPLTAPLILTILLTTLVASKGLANVPSASLVALATVVHAIGLPVEALAIITGVDVFMDMGRTATNVYGNTVAALIVSKLGDFTVSDPAAVSMSTEPASPALGGV